MRTTFLFCILCAIFLSACEPNVTPPKNDAKLVFKLKFDPTQDRLDAFAQPSSVPNGNAAQNPQFNGMSAHKIELVPSALTPVNGGAIVYHGAETTSGGDNAIDFDKAVVKTEGETFYEIPLTDVTPGTYPHIRVSVSYQNYDIVYNVKNVPTWPSGTTDLNNEKGTIASFVGFNSYIKDLTPKNRTKSINSNKLQGFWAFETNLSNPYSSANSIYSGDAQATTVVNPLNATTPTPPGSCLVTGSFDGNPLEITGNETEDIVVTLSFSTNQSFEWVDSNGNGELDIDASAGTTEAVVDMGLRGLKPSFQ
ncbi:MULTISPECIES: hypothetical protein [unclassified Aureispira]|uniref:hypothetical protein n=1 Tax=unclassified Aureispira TaxID=2649989 RepID=UPI0006979DD4|nr:MULTISPECIES: hypothetical protein [unclassified Aureispira]WMX13326.1 hypothetical protein QP953_21000 [Aureispira sp. CCB-E]